MARHSKFYREGHRAAGDDGVVYDVVKDICSGKTPRRNLIREVTGTWNPSWSIGGDLAPDGTKKQQRVAYKAFRAGYLARVRKIAKKCPR